MDMTKFLVTTLLFIFTVLIFPILEEAARNTTVTDATLPFIQNFPIVFIVIMACFPAYYLLKEAK